METLPAAEQRPQSALGEMEQLKSNEMEDRYCVLNKAEEA